MATHTLSPGHSGASRLLALYPVPGFAAGQTDAPVPPGNRLVTETTEPKTLAIPAGSSPVAQDVAGEDAMSDLFREHWGAGFGFAYKLVEDRALAEDLTAQAFTKIFAAIKAGKGPTGPFRPYLFRTVRTSLADHWNKTKHERIVEEIPDAGLQETGFALVEDEHDKHLAAAAFASLPERWQQVIWLMDVERLPPREVAPILGIAANAVSALLKRARAALRVAYLSEYAATGHQADCAQYRPMMAKAATGTASARETKALDEHLAECIHCPPVLESLREVLATMRGTAGSPPGLVTP